MITYGSSSLNFYCFTTDAAANDYPILHMELKKKADGALVLQVKEQYCACVEAVGLIEVVVPYPLKLVDFSGHLPVVGTIEIAAGMQVFEILDVELPRGMQQGSRFLQLAVIPGTVFGIMWTGLVKATADYRRTPKFWSARQQLILPFTQQDTTILVFPKSAQS